MIVRTMKAAESGGGSTDMHSKRGKSTINMYKQFRNLYRKLPMGKGLGQHKQEKLLKALSFVPEELPDEISKAGFKVDMSRLLKDLVD